MKNFIFSLTKRVKSCPIILGGFFLINSTVYSQVGIGTTNPKESSVLHISSTNKGLLIPEVMLTSTTDIITISNPADGLMVYSKGGALKEGFYTWSASESGWMRFVRKKENQPTSIKLSAEYPGATLVADGTNNKGEMFAHNTGEIGVPKWLNYYEWSSSETSVQDYDIVVKFQIPEDFKSWQNSNPIQLQFSMGAGTGLEVGVHKTTASTTLLVSTVVSTVNFDTWLVQNISHVNLSNLSAGDDAMLLIKLSSAANDSSKKIRIGNITLNYIK